MTRITPKRALGRGPSMRGRVTFRYVDGGWQAVKWQPKRHKPMTPAQAKGVDLFKQAAAAAKRADPDMLAMLDRVTQGTPYMPRDVLYKLWYGRVGNFVLTDGSRLRPMPSRIDTSLLLDNLDWTPGTMLFRGTDLWIPVPPGQNNDVLRYISASEAPQWTAPDPVQSVNVCLAYMTADGAANTTWPKIASFGGTIFDDFGGWSAANPTRITVPVGFTRLKLSAGVILTNLGTLTNVNVQIQLNGAASVNPGRTPLALRLGTTGFTNNAYGLVTAWRQPNPGDYYELRVNVNGTHNAGYLADTWLQMELY